MNRLSLITIALLTLTVLLLSTCNSCYRKQIYKLKNQPVKSIEKVKRDTIYEPVMVEVPAHAPIPEKEVVQLPSKIDTVYVMNDYYTYRYYSDTAITKYGNVIIQDTVGENKILSRSIHIPFTIPVVTTTTILSERQKGAVYAGLIAQGNRRDLLNGFGVGVSYKSKGNMLYEAGALYGLNNQVNYLFGVKWKLSFRK